MMMNPRNKMEKRFWGVWSEGHAKKSFPRFHYVAELERTDLFILHEIKPAPSPSQSNAPTFEWTFGTIVLVIVKLSPLATSRTCAGVKQISVVPLTSPLNKSSLSLFPLVTKQERLGWGRTTQPQFSLRGNRNKRGYGGRSEPPITSKFMTTWLHDSMTDGIQKSLLDLTRPQIPNNLQPPKFAATPKSPWQLGQPTSTMRQCASSSYKVHTQM